MEIDEFGKFIVNQRRKKGMTQKELAEKLNVTDKAVSRWERGRGLPSVDLIGPLATALELDIGELLTCGNEYTNKKEVESDVLKESLSYANLKVKEARKQCLYAFLFIVLLYILVIFYLLTKVDHLSYAILVFLVGITVNFIIRAMSILKEGDTK